MTDVPALKLYIYGGPAPRTTFSPPCGKAMMALAFKGLDFEAVELLLPQEIKKVNPRGRVPVLGWGDELIADSSDILSALDERVPDPPLQPATPGERARAKVLEDWADEVLYFYGVGLRWGPTDNFARLKGLFFNKLPLAIRALAPTFARREVVARLKGQGMGVKPEDVVRRELSECFDALEAWIDEAPGDYLVGDRPSRADLAVAAVIDQFAVAELTPRVAEELADRKTIARWREACRPAFPDVARGDSAA